MKGFLVFSRMRVTQSLNLAKWAKKKICRKCYKNGLGLNMKIFCLRTSKLMKNKLGGIRDIFCDYLNVLKSDGQEKWTKILIISE